jgi:O-antigen/teichoic acid export membrane protein
MTLESSRTSTEPVGATLVVEKGRKPKWRLGVSADLRSISLLTLGTAVSQVISLLFTRHLGRVYGPTEYGAFALFISFASFAGVLASARYEQAIILAPSEHKARGLVRLCLTLFALALPVLIGIGWLIQRLQSGLDSSVWVWLLVFPAQAIAIASQELTYNVLNRAKEYRTLATLLVIEATTMGLTASLLALRWPVFTSLALAQLLRSLVAPSYGLIRHVIRGSSAAEAAPIREVAREYSRFPSFNLPHTVLDLLRANSVMYAISAWFGATSAGHYSMAARVLEAPLILLGSAVGRVFARKASELHGQQGDVHGYTKRTMLALAGIGVCALGPIVLAGPSLFSLVFGPNWSDAGAFARQLAPWWLLRFIFSPVSQLPLVLNEQKRFFWVGMGYNLAIGSGILAGANVEPQLFALGIGLIPALYLCWTLRWVLNLAKVRQAHA